jgi:SsrA-binding protein
MAYITNKKATFNYEIIDRIEAGIELFGHEVKSIKAGKGNLEGSYIIVRGGEAFLVGALISPYQVTNTPDNYDERRPRRILLHKAEILRIAEAGTGTGRTTLPLSLYPKGKSGKIKIEIGIARGKKKHDKRETIKKRETEREVRREMKG